MPSASSSSWAVDAEADLAARRDEDHFRLAARSVAEHIGAARDPGRRRVLAAVQCRQGLPRQRQHGRLVSQLDNIAIGLDDLIGVAGPQHHQAGLGAEGSKLLHRLVRRAVLAVTHGIVGEHKDRGQLHQRRQPNGRPCIVTEDEESGAEGPQFRQREPIDRGRHRVLADAEMQVPAARSARLEVSGALERQGGLVG